MSGSPPSPEVEEFEEFICTCSDEGSRLADGLMADVQARLSRQSDYTGRLVAEGHLLTAVVVSLDRDFGARITEMITDHWSAVKAATYDGKFETWIDCDLVEHGVAATWRAFADRAQVPDSEGS